MTKLFKLFLTLCLLVGIESARILIVFAIPSISHNVVFRPFTLELAKRGHEVIVVTTDPLYPDGNGPTNYTEIDIHDVSYSMWREHILSDTVTTGAKEDLQTQLEAIYYLMNKVFEKQVLTPGVQKIIKDKTQKFDLLIVEACVLTPLGWSHIFKVPVIQFSSFGAFMHNLGTVGMPIHPIVHPNTVRQKVNNLSKWEKLVGYYQHFRLERTLAAVEVESDIMLRRVFGNDIPPLSELRNNVDLLMLNVHPMWELNKPSPPNVIYLGGLHQKPPRELPQDIKSYLDSSKHGVIYISFGTNVEPANFVPRKLKVFLNVFSKLPYDILWKWNKDELPGKPDNVKISKWMPQPDLLRHPKMKMFITQAGLQSTDEAIAAGAPLIGIPLFGDQWYNAELYVHYNIGLNLDMETLTEETLANGIDTVLKNESTFRKNAARLHSLMYDQPMTSLERAVWWTEYAIRHSGARHLRSPSANMSWYQYFEIELVLYIFLGLLSVILAIVYTLSRLVKMFKPKSKVKIS